MIISEDRQGHLAQLATNCVYDDDLVDFTDEDASYRVAKKAVVEFVKEEADIDVKAREKVASLKRGVLEGTPEWEILYRKYYEEERSRRGQG